MSDESQSKKDEWHRRWRELNIVANRAEASEGVAGSLSMLLESVAEALTNQPSEKELEVASHLLRAAAASSTTHPKETRLVFGMKPKGARRDYIAMSCRWLVEYEVRHEGSTPAQAYRSVARKIRRPVASVKRMHLREGRKAAMLWMARRELPTVGLTLGD